MSEITLSILAISAITILGGWLLATKKKYQEEEIRRILQMRGLIQRNTFIEQECGQQIDIIREQKERIKTLEGRALSCADCHQAAAEAGHD